MTARFGSACAASSPTARSRARSRSRPPAPAIPPPSPAPRPARSIRSARSPRPIAATMPAAMPRPPNSSRALDRARRPARRPGRGAGQRGAAALQSRPLCRGGRAVRPRRGAGRRRSGDRAAAAQLSRHAPAQPGPGRARRWPSSTGRCRPIARRRPVRDLVIDRPTAGPAQRRIAGRAPAARAGGGLTAEDKAQILDGQALQLRGTILRLAGPRRRGGRRRSTGRSTELVAIRGGRDRRDRVAARADPWRARRASPRRAATGPRPSASIGRRSPCSRPTIRARPALLSAQARLAGFYARTGRTEPARALFREIVAANVDRRRQLAGAAPHARALFRPARRAEAASRTRSPTCSRASQVLVRPGVAQTQAVLARELSGGSDEAARLFRQSVDLDPRHRARPGRARPARGGRAPTAADAARSPSCAPRSRSWQQRPGRDPGAARRIPALPGVVAAARSRLADLQRAAPPGRGLLQDDRASATTPMRSSPPATAARAFRIGATPAELERAGRRAARRPSRSVENGQHLTYPFDVERAYRALSGSCSARSRASWPASRHLIFEPDGAMLRLPPNLLVMDRAGVDAYRARAPPARATTASISAASHGSAATATSAPRSRPAPSATSARRRRRAPRPNISASARTRRPRGYLSAGGGDARRRRDAATAPGRSPPGTGRSRPTSCSPRPAHWRAAGAGEAEIVTGAAFTDTRDHRPAATSTQFRILHFATHGLVTRAAAGMPGAAGAC